MSQPVRSNNFDTLRMAAALVVVLSHSVQITYGSEVHEIVWQLTRHQTNAGALAVDIFFSMSGYLIARSFLQTGHPLNFVFARLLRITPALAVLLVVLSFCVGPIASSLPTTTYFRCGSVYAFIARNVLYPYGGGLPLVFENNPMRGVIDGSLWTLRLELACYLLVLLLGVSGLLTKRKLLLLYAASSIVAAVFAYDVRTSLVADFLGGATIFMWEVRLRGSVAAFCAVGWVLSLLTEWQSVGTSLFAPYLVLYLALSPTISLPKLARYGDLSYGTYIYAYPVQQIIVEAMGDNSRWYWTFLVALPPVLLLAALSWHFVEAPSLALKNRLRLSVSQNSSWTSVQTLARSKA